MAPVSESLCRLRGLLFLPPASRLLTRRPRMLFAGISSPLNRAHDSSTDAEADVNETAGVFSEAAWRDTDRLLGLSNLLTLGWGFCGVACFHTRKSAGC